jgi:hypothetical protein
MKGEEKKRTEAPITHNAIPFPFDQKKNNGEKEHKHKFGPTNNLPRPYPRKLAT